MEAERIEILAIMHGRRELRLMSKKPWEID